MNTYLEIQWLNTVTITLMETLQMKNTCAPAIHSHGVRGLG